MSSVQSIYINKTEMYMQVNTYDVLHVHTLPVDAEDNEIVWEIEDTNVVSLNNNIGQLRANSIGDSDVTVYVKSNPSIRATCKVHVRGHISVESISFPVTEFTLNVGKTMDLGVVIKPLNATNPQVTWWSCCPEVATVASDGTVNAKAPGIVDIYASAENGSLTAVCKIKVIVDEVTIQKDNFLAEVVFNSTGKTWKCIFADMIFDEKNRLNYYFNQRLWHNLYVDLSENNKNYRTYTDEELKLLYAIDPHGVAIYIESFAAEKYSDLSERVKYKDRIFKLLFKKTPIYFKRKNEQEWEITEQTSNISTVISESETIFGMHPIYDKITLEQLQMLAVDLFQMLVGALFPTNILVSTAIFITECTQDFFKYRYLYFMDVDILDMISGVIGFVADDGTNVKGIESMFIETNTAWVFKFVSAYADLYSIISSEISFKPNFTRNIIEYCTDNILYKINLKLNNGETHLIDKINEMAKLQ